MKTRDEVITLFRDKYDSLQKVCQQQIEPFNEAAIYQNPGGGWQLNLEQPGTDYKAAITLRPNDDVPHETHGVIGARWFQEGGAFDVNGIPGWLGYPVSDEREEMQIVIPPVLLHVPESPNPLQIRVPGAVSEFEYGRVCWHCGLTWERVYEENTEGQMFSGGEGPFAVCPSISCFLNTNGSNHLPPDIEAAVKTLLSIRNLHVTGDMTHVCELQNGGRATWRFQVPTEEYNEMIANVWRDGINIRVAIDAVPKPKPRSVLDTIFGGSCEEKKHEAFTIPNNCKVR